MKIKSIARNQIAGFTLLEVMITTTIIAILAAFAWGSYQGYIVKTHRVAAAACMMQDAQYMERFHTLSARYDQNRDGDTVALPDAECHADLAKAYVFSLSNLSAASYTVVATPVGRQAAQDTKCGALSVNEQGRKNVSGSEPPNKCF